MIGPKPTADLNGYPPDADPRRLLPRLIARCSLLLACCMAAAPGARAEGLQMRLEMGGALPVSKPQARQYGLGGEFALGLLYPVVPTVVLGVTVRGLVVTDKEGAPASGQVDYGTGTLYSGELSLRLQPFAEPGGHPIEGLFVEGLAGAGLTGKLQRALFGAGLGYAIPVGDLALSPFVRYLQIVETGDALSKEDARLALLGVELAFGNAPPVQQHEEPLAPPPPPPDQDGDGIVDADDSCPTEPEDVDGFEDQDGCPDKDNDKDGIEDGLDACPDDAEDIDGFADEDGCPEPDNDLDGFLDADDQCPDDAEVVNGNKDYDGCPDEGLIEFKDDRIVLEERVLFALERARVRSRAMPVMRAIVELQKQHPEWDEIRIEGHADARGDEAYNRALSDRRARNVRLLLAELGIPAKLMESVGYGSSRLRDKGDEEEAHRRNRRVEFVVVTRRSPEPNAIEPVPAVPEPAPAVVEAAPGEPEQSVEAEEDIVPQGEASQPPAGAVIPPAPPAPPELPTADVEPEDTTP